MGFFRDFLSSDNSKVNTITVLSSLLVIPIMLLAMAVLVYHCFYLRKGLDSNVVNLILGLVGGGGVGYGVGRASGMIGKGPPANWTPPPKPPPGA